MQNMERQIQSGTHSMEAFDIRSAMVIVDPSKTSLPPPPDVSTPTAKRLSCIMAAYKLMDVLCALESPSVSCTNPRYAKWAIPGLLPVDKASIASTVHLQTNQFHN